MDKLLKDRKEQSHSQEQAHKEHQPKGATPQNQYNAKNPQYSKEQQHESHQPKNPAYKTDSNAKGQYANPKGGQYNPKNK